MTQGFCKIGSLDKTTNSLHPPTAPSVWNSEWVKPTDTSTMHKRWRKCAYVGNTIPILNENHDLWEYSPTTGLWIWVSGSSDLQCSAPLTNGQCFVGYSPATGVYGAVGVPASANVPGGRYYSVGWIGSDGNLWLFGGLYGNTTSDSTQHNGFFNDLWQFSPSTTQWTGMGGSDTVPCPPSGVALDYVQGCGVLGLYGVKGTASRTNAPGGGVMKPLAGLIRAGISGCLVEMELIPKASGSHSTTCGAISRRGPPPSFAT